MDNDTAEASRGCTSEAGGGCEPRAGAAGDAMDTYPWEPAMQLAADLQAPPFGEALEEILRWHEAEVRRESEARAVAAGGLFDFDDLPQPEPRQLEAPARAPPQRRRGPVKLAERAAQRALEGFEESKGCRTVRQQIQDALDKELKAVPLGDIRRRQLRERAQQETACAPPDPPPSRQQAREWARLLCVLQHDTKSAAPPPDLPEGQAVPAPKPVPIEEPEAIEILKRRADVNHPIGDLQRFPLHTAAERCYPQLITELIKFRADPNKADFAGEVPLHTAAHSGGWCEAPPAQRRLAVERLVEGRADANFANPRGRTPLHIAASAGDSTVMTALLREAADANAADLGGFTPLMWAAGHGKADAVQSLMDARADPSLKANRGQTAMLFGLTNGKTLVVEALESHLRLMDRQAERQEALRRDSEPSDAAHDSQAEVAKRNDQAGAQAKATLHCPYMGKVLREYAPDLRSNVY